MLTRLEVDGFKNLVGFSADFGPFTCIAGPNGVGKSNVFDAIHFLSLLADHTITEAALRVRNGDADTTDVRDLFCAQLDIAAPEFTIAAEMIVEPGVIDDLGRPADATSTYLRYEVRIGVETIKNSWKIGRLVLLAETLSPISNQDAANRLIFPDVNREFLRRSVKNRRKTPSALITTETGINGQVEIVVNPDGASKDPVGRVVAADAPRTVVGTSNSSAAPTLLATRREMQSWQIFAFEPSVMRKPDRFTTDPHIDTHGGHMAATLNRLVIESGRRGEAPINFVAQIVSRVAPFVPITGIDHCPDLERKTYTLQVKESNGVWLPAASLSDGTLRFVALALLASDTYATGLFCIEEPENGIHPVSMPQLVRLIQDIAFDADYAIGEDNPFRQVIVATHSPNVVQLQNPDDLLFATPALVKWAGSSVYTVRCLPLVHTWRAREGHGVGIGSAIPYLAIAPGAKLDLDDLAIAK